MSRIEHFPNGVFYKFMSKKREADFLAGRVKFGTIDEYRGHRNRQARNAAIYIKPESVRRTMSSIARSACIN